MPVGEFAANGLFDAQTAMFRATALEGAASIGLLLGLAVLALAGGYALWRRRTYV